MSEAQRAKIVLSALSVRENKLLSAAFWLFCAYSCLENNEYALQMAVMAIIRYWSPIYSHYIHTIYTLYTHCDSVYIVCI